ncbi:hypothetical protein DPMN_013104 [Dreissena polymorpha]|uniref:Uncharacterized protein n=1 Tax=Dreissena polymorpha TaxID=45954 RepID=A0A9D4N6R7_DREPO|nr:hypothetical protein DPMN_013104 [Dreissena polymorpha]
MGSKRDEVSLHPDESEDSFYGFSDEETFNEKLNAKEKATPKEKAQISSKDKKNDIKSLRELLGIPSTETQYADDDDITSLFGTSLENLPRMTIEVDADQISDTDDVIKQRKRTNIDMSSALFDDDEAECDTWELPRLKAPDKGKPISPSLAKRVQEVSQCGCYTSKSTPKRVDMDIKRGAALAREEVEDLRSHHIIQEMSTRKIPSAASILITSSWSKGTRQQYKYAWQNWVLWNGIR